jgi:hypothetical protein
MFFIVADGETILYPAAWELEAVIRRRDVAIRPRRP